MRIKELIREIHRRTLWQVVLIYLGASWAVIEAVDLVANRLLLPSWIPGLAIVLVITGLPVVLATAYMQETETPTPRPEEPSTVPATSQESGDSLRRWLKWRNTLGAGVVAFALLGVAAAGWFAFGGADTGDTTAMRSLAVLPLENYTGDPEQQYIVDAMTEQLISELAQIRDLVVMSRSAVAPYRENAKPIRVVAEELGVDAVIEGSLFRTEDQVRITVQLIDGATEAHVWANDYVRDFRDLLSLQKDVASAIANEIEVGLTPEDEARLAAEQAIDSIAQEAYLRGVSDLRRFRQGDGGRAALERSIESFREAVAAEPDWASAHAGLAEAYTFMAGALGEHEYYRLSKEAAHEAIRLDDSVAQAHASLAFVLHVHDWDWAGAEREYARTFELDPNYGYWGNSAFLMTSGRYEEAVANLRWALERDPLSDVLRRQLADALACAGRYEAARSMLERLVQERPEYWELHTDLGGIHLQLGSRDRALQAYEKAVELSGRDAQALRTLAYAYASLDQKAEAHELLAELERAGEWMPDLYAVLGETDKAVAQLEQAYEERSGELLFIRCLREAAFTDLTQLEGLREHPRFQALLRRIDFPD